MIKLKSVNIENYKSIENKQKFDIESDITVLVGKNEAGKTATLEAIAKCDYFEDDADFKFDSHLDFPRKHFRKTSRENDGNLNNITATILEYLIDDELIEKIEDDLYVKVDSSFSITYRYDGGRRLVSHNTNGSTISVISKILSDFGVKEEYIEQLKNAQKSEEFLKLLEDIEDYDFDDANIKITAFLDKVSKTTLDWDDKLSAYIYEKYLKPQIPKFMYFDEYYELGSDIELRSLASKRISELTSSEKTGKAFLELADIDTEKIIDESDFERYIAELEATEAIIAQELFKYWKSNENLDVKFSIKNKTDTSNRVIDNILNIRIKNTRTGVSLPLSNRSKGFNWFFSFLVWFMKIQETGNTRYILLLDEPGLNLHAKAQEDLLRFIDDLAVNYQIIYTTHSPFMVDSTKFNRVRTIYEDKEIGTKISDSVDETDSDTLFPLQAALGYNIAQNLFISKRNLLVEGLSDLLYLEGMSNLLVEQGRIGLSEKITIMPVGGADKIATFISLLRGNNLNFACLLDTFTEQSAEARLNNMVVAKLIAQKNIIFYSNYTNFESSDCEDIFSKDEFLEFYNKTIGVDDNVSLNDLDESNNILPQLNNGKRFNHYRPAHYFASNITEISISDETLSRFEEIFKHVNKLLK